MNDSIPAFRRAHIGRAIARAMWVFQDRFEVAIRARGFEDYRQADTTVIARLPTDGGARVTELARRAGVTKQAMGKLVAGLEERDYVHRVPDPDDGRAQCVHLTERGVALLRVGSEVIDEIEAQWAAALGPGELTRMRKALLRIADTLGPPEYL